MSQISFFDGSQPLKITKPIRLIECFAGYGSQALALKISAYHKQKGDQAPAQAPVRKQHSPDLGDAADNGGALKQVQIILNKREEKKK